MENGREVDLDVLPRGRGVVSGWLADTNSEQERSDRVAMLYNSNQIFDALRKMLEKMYRESKTRVRKSSDNPNWAQIVVAEEKYREAIEDVYRLLPSTDH